MLTLLVLVAGGGCRDGTHRERILFVSPLPPLLRLEFISYSHVLSSDLNSLSFAASSLARLGSSPMSFSKL